MIERFILFAFKSRLLLKYLKIKWMHKLGNLFFITKARIKILKLNLMHNVLSMFNLIVVLVEVRTRVEILYAVIFVMFGITMSVKRLLKKKSKKLKMMNLISTNVENALFGRNNMSNC